MLPLDPRDLEWQRRYEQNDTPWDKNAPAPPLVAYLRENTLAGRVLVPGCGRGHDARALARQPDCTVVGLDLSPSAVAEARQLATQAGIGATLSFVVDDFFNLPPEMEGSFDWLVEHTCFCALEPRQRPDYVLTASWALRPGGQLFGIFYLNPDTQSSPPFPISREELKELFEPHFVLLDQWMPAETFPERVNREWVMILQKR